MTKEMQPEALRLAAAFADDDTYVSLLMMREAAAELRRLHAENEELLEALQFVERWAVHHGSKPSCTLAEALSCIQHYPPIRAITNSYADGKRPVTFDPYARIAELERELEARDDTIKLQDKRVDELKYRLDAQRKPLTNEQIDFIAGNGMRNAAGGIYATCVYEFARAIERAHGIGEAA